MKTKGFFISMLAVLIAASIFQTGCKREVEAVTVEPDIAYIRIVGETTTFTHTISPDNAKNKTVRWKSSEESVASVEEGIVKGLKEGFCSISCTAVDGNFQDVSTVCVGDLDGTFYGVFKTKTGEILAENVEVVADRIPNSKRGNIFIPKSIEAMSQDINFELVNFTDSQANNVPSISVSSDMTLEGGSLVRITGGYIYGHTFKFDLEIGAVSYEYTGEKN